MHTEAITIDSLKKYPEYDRAFVDEMLNEAIGKSKTKIVVLDDDPTGIQTVHGVYVYTNWEKETILEAFKSPDRMFFILTNSRGMTAAESKTAHIEMAKAIEEAAVATSTNYIIVSRSDSTLRGHYPLETDTLRETLEEMSNEKFDGEIIYPFFLEGGRYTIGDTHYVKEGEMLIPAGETEFAKDKSFGYKNSNLPLWCEEKSGGEIKAADVLSISLDELRDCDIRGIEKKLMAVSGFGKVIVNSISYEDCKVFTTALLNAVTAGKRFILRSAAAITKVLGGVPDKELLTHDELVQAGDSHGGIVLVGSHVNKTTRQLEKLHDCSKPLEFITFDQHLVLIEGGLEGEVARIVKLADEKIKNGESVVVFTRRDRLDLDTDDRDKQLLISVQISDAVTSIIEKLSVKPRFIIAKGGITSSDVGTKALAVKKALVMGQIRAGIPVWMTGEESKFPKMPYIIFPGNVGADETLLEAVEVLIND